MVLKFLKNNFSGVVVAILVCVIIFQRCDTNPPDISIPIIVRDTVWERYDSIIWEKPDIVKIILPGEIEIEYLPDTNYTILKEQYNALVNSFLTKNIYEKTFPIDSFGYIKITDTISKNTLIGRKFFYDLKIPTVTETTTNPYIPKTQIYVGMGGQTNLIDIGQFNARALLKTKRDQIYGVGIGMDTKGNISYMFDTYWKIKF